MKEETLRFIKDQNLFDHSDKLLVAVSGGIDSCVLLDLLYALKFNCIVAHCNFKLRGKDSEDDAKFVKDLAYNYKFEFVSKEFETTKYSEEKGISIQMAARELRYIFFEEISLSHNCNVIATAHHADDMVETFYINLLHGTGLKGLCGIPIKSGKIVRPLLFATRLNIKDYASQSKLKWREDSSNVSNKYIRNKIRNEIIPLLEEINPQFKKIMQRNIINLKNSEALFKELLDEKTNKIIQKKGDTIYISIKELNQSISGKTILFHLIYPFGFESKQIDKIWNSLNSDSGKMFYSKDHVLNKDRKFLIINKNINNDQFIKYYIDEEIDFINEPIKLSIERCSWKSGQIIPKQKNIFYADAERITFPLIIRKWKTGDYFHPFGMSGVKKISDFFIDEKIPNSEKKNIWILESSGKIMWVINYRPDDNFKITPKTQYVIKLQSF